MAKRLAHLLGLEHAARSVYNRVASGRRTVDVRLLGSPYRFAAPTFTIAEELAAQSESRIMELLVASLRPGDVAWDVGASYGLYTFPLSRSVGPGGCVYAFEPEAASRHLLERNLALNAVSNVTVSACALGAADGSAPLYRSRSANIGAHSLIRRTDYRVARHGVTVPVRSGDSLVARGTAARPAALKIDVEGTEASVLEGMDALLRDPALRVVVVEVHPEILVRAGRRPDEIEDALRRHGFSAVATVDRGRQFHLIARRGEV